MNDPNDLKDLTTLLPEPVAVLAGGEEVRVHEIRTGQLVQAVRLVQMLMDNLVAAGKAAPGGGGEVVADASAADLLLAAYGPTADFVCLSTGKTREWFDGLRGDDGVAVAGKVLEVNLDFFAERLLPRFLELAGAARRAGVLYGSLRLSEPSSGPDTAGETSSGTPSRS